MRNIEDIKSEVQHLQNLISMWRGELDQISDHRCEKARSLTRKVEQANIQMYALLWAMGNNDILPLCAE